MNLCGQLSGVHGAMPCPREVDHPGRHFWAIPFEQGHGWRVVVYAGDPRERRRLCRGAFTDQPNPEDVYALLIALVHARRRERQAASNGARRHVPVS